MSTIGAFFTRRCARRRRAAVVAGVIVILGAVAVPADAAPVRPVITSLSTHLSGLHGGVTIAV